MILVTAGTHNQSFERLIRKMDEIAGDIDEEVLIQIGHTKYKPKNSKYFDFATRERMEELNKRARIVVTHGGAGSIITALKFKKPIIVVPRLKKFGEHINDHQLDLTRELEKDGKIVGVYDIDDLENKIHKIKSFKTKKSKKSRLIKIIKNYLESLEEYRG